MKKRILSAVLLSTVVLATAAPLAGSVKADDTDAKIAQANSTISSATSASQAAQSQVDSIQSQVDSLQSQQASMTAQVQKLQAEQKATSQKIQKLNSNIQERSAALKAQARSAQVNGTSTNYVDALMNSKSLTDAIQKVTAMATVASANKTMLKAQESDQKNMQVKLKDNQTAYNKATQLQQSLASQSYELTTQQAQLKVAQLNYQATITSAEGTKQNLLSEKAQAEAAAQAAAKAQAAAAEKAAAVQAAATKPVASAAASTTTVAASQTTAASSAAAPVASSTASVASTTQESSAAQTPVSSSAVTPQPSTNDDNTTPVSSSSSSNGSNLNYSASNPYPAGQCTAFVWQYFGGKIPTYMGNAGDWAVYANSGPAAGTIAVFSPGLDGAGAVGHVAVVLSVSGSNMTIIEGNFNGGWGTTRTVPTAGVSFINPNA